MSLAEAAKQVGRSPGYLRQAVHRGILVAKKVGNSWGVEQKDLDNYADKHLGKLGMPPTPSPAVGRGVKK